MTLPMMLMAGIGLALGLVWWRIGRRAALRIEFYHCWCDVCGQKVRYPQEKAGRPGGCPRCKHRWTLPAVPQLVRTVTPRIRVGAVRQRHAG